MNAVEDAEQTAARLRAKRADALAKAAVIDERRADVAFAAHTGDAKAKATLDALNRECAAVLQEIGGIDAAIAEAERRVAAAKREAERDAAREKARQVRAIADANVGRGAKILAAAQALRDEIVRANADLEKMRRLGAPLANSRLVELALTRAITPFLREAGLDLDLVPPLQRHDVEMLIAGYVGTASAWAAEIPGDGPAQQSEAA